MLGVFMVLGGVANGGTVIMSNVEMLGEAVKYVFRRVKGSFLNADGIRIHYTDEGHGEPVVLIHGYGADADNNWRIPGVSRALRRNFRVIALDNRGHGLSEKPHDANLYGTEFVKDVVRLLDHLRIEKAHVVGYSMGGFITLKLVTMFPGRLLSAAPCGAGWYLPVHEKASLLDTIADSLEQGHGFWPLLIEINTIGRKPNRLALGIVNALMTHFNDVKALACVMRAFKQLAVTEEELRANTVPTLSIVGTRDPLREGVDSMLGVMANHRAVFIEGADHLTALRGKRFMAALTGFLAENPAGASGPETIPQPVVGAET
jgi:pimeloyl-ACP methyl ester carboxylesterase